MIFYKDFLLKSNVKSSFSFCKNLEILLFLTSRHDQMDFGDVRRQKIIVIIIVTMYNRNPVPPGCFPKFPQQPTFFVTFFLVVTKGIL